MLTDFAVFILTHGRPDKQITYKTLRRQGYTGPVYFVVDNEDKTLDQYRKRYGEQVIVFDKAAVAATFDECDNFTRLGRKSVVYARNACFDIARQLGITYFLELDDDYTDMEYRLDADLKYAYSQPKNLDALFALVLDFYKAIPALTIAFAQGGDLIGGRQAYGLQQLRLKRKAMNSFFCSVERPFQFTGRINEDVIMYTTLGARGRLIFTIYNAKVTQAETQAQAGGMTGIYEAAGTYVKSFYAVMNSPAFVSVQAMGVTRYRIHHHVEWANAVPVIISQEHRKE